MLRQSNEPDTGFLASLVGDLFEVGSIYRHNKQLVVTLIFRFDRTKSTRMFRDRLLHSGYDHSIHETPEHIILTIDPRRRLRIPPLNVFLFFATLASVYIFPVFYRHGTIPETIAALKQGEGLIFTVALISILFVHEMGHFVASRRRGIVTSWPYFIPSPFFIGTFGAVIKSKSPFWNRRDLIEVGAWGPIAGWIVALLWMIYGFTETTVISSQAIPDNSVFFGEPLLFKLLQQAIMGPLPSDAVLFLGEAAFAGWVGLLVTAINLLPMGQLDGGHIVYGLIGRKQAIFGWFTVAALIALGFQAQMWWLFAGFGLFFGVVHPPTMNDRHPTGRLAVVLGIVSMIILVLSFIPVPIQL